MGYLLCPGDPMTGCFVSYHAFILRQNKLFAKEVSFLENRLGFASTMPHINEPDLWQDLKQFFRKMRCKWHVWNEIPQSNEEVIVL